MVGLRAEQAADDELRRQFPRLSGAASGVAASADLCTEYHDASWEASGKCCASHECPDEGNCTLTSSGGHRGGPDDDCECDCDCHAIAAAGREAVLVKLEEGVDFSPLFRPDLFETADMDAEQEQALDAFERTLIRAHGWCAVAKACPSSRVTIVHT